MLTRGLNSNPPGIVYFCAIQFQKDERLYERLFAESMMYFYRNRNRFSDWQAVVIYPSRATEIMVYKFTSLNRQEIEAMLGLN